MDSSVLLKDQIWFLRVCHHVSNVLYSVWSLGSDISSALFCRETRIIFMKLNYGLPTVRLWAHWLKVVLCVGSTRWVCTWELKQIHLPKLSALSTDGRKDTVQGYFETLPSIFTLYFSPPSSIFTVIMYYCHTVSSVILYFFYYIPVFFTVIMYCTIILHFLLSSCILLQSYILHCHQIFFLL